MCLIIQHLKKKIKKCGVLSEFSRWAAESLLVSGAEKIAL